MDGMMGYARLSNGSRAGWARGVKGMWLRYGGRWSRLGG